MRTPWTAPGGDFSYTTLWLNLAALITVVRFLVGESLTVGGFSWSPGEMNAALPGAILAALGMLYHSRRKQDNSGGFGGGAARTAALTPPVEVSPGRGSS